MDHIKPYVPSIATVVELKSGKLLELLVSHTKTKDVNFLAYTKVWLEIAFNSPMLESDRFFSQDIFSESDFEKLVSIGLDVKKLIKMSCL